MRNRAVPVTATASGIALFNQSTSLFLHFLLTYYAGRIHSCSIFVRFCLCLVSAAAYIQTLSPREASDACFGPSHRGPTQFLLRDAMLSAVYAVVVCLCVCVCVCVSVTLRYCIKTAKRRITQIMPHDSSGILVF